MIGKVKIHLYLDIDDVLNTEKGYELATQNTPKLTKLLSEDFEDYKYLAYKLWDKGAIDNLRLILNTSEPDVYIHSSWQWYFKLKHFASSKK